MLDDIVELFGTDFSAWLAALPLPAWPGAKSRLLAELVLDRSTGCAVGVSEARADGAMIDGEASSAFGAAGRAKFSPPLFGTPTAGFPAAGADAAALALTIDSTLASTAARILASSAVTVGEEICSLVSTGTSAAALPAGAVCDG